MDERIPPRLRSKIQPVGDCWLWTGSRRSHSDHGTVWWKGRSRNAHRVVWELVRGAIPDGCHVHHECPNQHCVNPDHLRVVTVGEHRALHPPVDAQASAAANRRARTHCKRGHEYTPANTYINTKGARVCRTCREIHHRTHALKGAA